MKKAWKREHELYTSSTPVVLDEEEQTWDAIEGIEKTEDLLLGMKWFSNVPGSGAPERVIVGAIQATENMGYKVEGAEKLVSCGIGAYEGKDFITLNRITARIWRLLSEAEKDPKSDYWEHPVYDSFEKIASEVDFPADVRYDTKAGDFYKKTYLAWQAQIVGGAFGTALEGYTRENIKKAFGNVTDYVRKPNTYNDDITYEIAFQKAFAKMGYDVTSVAIAEEWVSLIPFGWSAEEWALKNIKMGIFPPRSGYENNPYREWIGAQMRAAVCGMAAPGDARAAARLAFVDGSVSHHNNGVLGEIFNAVMVALAYVEKDVRTLVKKAIDMIPARSEYREVLDFALDLCENKDDWEQAIIACEERFKRYNWIHSYPNAAAEVVALWFGNGDFDETLRIIGMAGYDVDCNAAQIMAVVAVMNGFIPKRWTEPFQDDLDTYVRGMKKTTISTLAQETVDAVNRARHARVSQGDQ